MIPAGRPGLRLRFYDGVPPKLRDELKSFARWLRRALRFDHPVRVTVVPHTTVMGPDGAPGWATFVIPPPDYMLGDVVRIYVAGGSPWVLRRDFGYDGDAVLEKVLHDLAHELVHYEQWRDCRPVSERGVNRRARGLVSRYLARRGAAAGPRAA